MAYRRAVIINTLANLEEVRQRKGLYLRGPSTLEERADLHRRTTEAGLRPAREAPGEKE